MITLSPGKKILIALSGCLLAGAYAFAQQHLTYYITKNGKITDIPDSAAYVRMVSDADSDTGFYNIKEYYRDGKLKLVGKTSTTNGSMLQGQCVSFFPSGKRKTIATYNRGRPQGDVYNYYPNGKLYNVSVFGNVSTFGSTTVNTSDLMSAGTIVKACYDTTGKVLLENGNGHLVNYDDDFKIILDEGDLSKGKKTGTWKGYDITDTVTFTEQYESDKLIEGISTNTYGKVEHYTQRQVNPEFPGGEKELAHFLSKNINYPSLARKYNIQGKVYVSFVIEKDGSLDQIKILREPGSGTGDEVIRVIRLSPNWKPGTRYGQISKIRFTLPVNFSLGEEVKLQR
ncbi:hypothetical protein BEL04_21160 [Mucilaginibacter sp. PPCGB 2223]|uniref:energy transducer TonB n=1 Tax=Mucilaginibacter sp. PPCGB 2223 TaxID=1886027 RepID=UPI0008248EDA|nr:energy transducer TonB [Mucilaginibacter sp. PPCGB 2223]OCX51214.1 hypothetical protein BEL04_21160 [Mucilaginibacter sp. PPCGB 2223]